jgi:hypothetical protein
VVKNVRLPSNYHLDNLIFNKITYRHFELNFYEDIHNSLEIYIWLSYKYEVEFVERELARVLKDRACKIIDSIIEKQAFDSSKDIRSEDNKKKPQDPIKLITENLRIKTEKDDEIFETE